MPEKLKMHSPDLVASNIDRIAELFPNCVTEAAGDDGQVTRKIDFDILRQELSGEIVEGPLERYHLNWPGKREAMLAANAPIAKTLRPCREESVDFDATQNLFIEGDNLEALKLLQETYLGKVKMIFIDPPYNTGREFIYNDDFASDANEYLLRSLQVGEGAVKLVANTDANGRFHSDWLSMLFSRLRLARNLISDDGIVFIAIDDNEQANLHTVCDEVFGADNFVATVVWQKVFSPKNSARHFSVDHDYLLAYARNADSWKPRLLPRTAAQDALYKNPDDDPRGPWTSGDLTARNFYGDGQYELTGPTGKKFSPGRGTYWRTSMKKMAELDADNRVWWGEDGNNMPRLKRFLSEVADGRVPQTLWFHKEVGNTQDAKRELLKYVEFKESENVLNSVKPTALIQRALQISTQPNEQAIVVDFFSGSGSTAHAVIKQNFEDGGNRRFIAVQIDEPLPSPEPSLQSIFDIGVQRVTNYRKQVQNEVLPGLGEIDLGFRVLKIDSSNMKDVYYSPADTSQAMLGGLVDNIKPDRTGEDLLFQVLLDCGVDLGLPIRTEKIDDCDVFFVNDSQHASPDLVACFDPDVPESLVKTIAAKSPLRAVFRDQCFATDADKINVEQIFKQMSPQTQLRSL